ncbi:hypothetical protein EDB19DRAFT_1634476, partial [Suillus lakei]
GWTVTHGFFAWMGGFMLYVSDEPQGTLTPDELLQFVREGSVEMPVISEAEIEDRSKGDALSKGIAILQLAWFVTQLVARYIQNLPITLLETDTLAVAALTCIPYGLWRKRPKDAGCPYIVHRKATATHPNHLTSYQYVIWRQLTYPFLGLMGFMVLIYPRAARSRCVPSLGGCGRYHAKIVLLIGCFSGMVFGEIHCLGRNHFFYRHVKYILWRATSLGITCVPIFILLDIVSYTQNWKVLTIFRFSFGVIASYIYIAARVTLSVLMMLSLRSLPPGVYDTVTWTKFIPHL